MLNPIQWYRNHFTCFIHCNRKASTIKLSKPLWDRIKKDQSIIDRLNDQPHLDGHPGQPSLVDQNDGSIDCKDISGFAVLFSKIRDVNSFDYAFFVNPVWHLHGVKNPRMLQTVPISISESGNVGFQTIQPSVEEIAAVYGIPTDQEQFDLKVKRSTFNAEPFYILQRP